jgi:hypothetical protein
MSCCAETQTAPLTERHRMRVRYGGGRPLAVKGLVTGRTYHFSGTRRLQLIDPRDAVSLCRSGPFRIEAVVEASVQAAVPAGQEGDLHESV